MGRAVLTAALRQVGVWQARHPTTPPLNVAVNLSARQLDDPHLVDEVAAALHGSDTLPGSLVLEITETDTMRHFDGAVESLTSLRRLGVRIAIDDFGTGFSSLSYLARLPIDILKIDKAFTDHITAANASSRVAVSICRLGHSLDLEIVAEGVESGEQVTALQAQGCQLAQGYHFSVPLPAAAVDAMLSASSSFPVSAPPEASSLSTRGDRDATEGRFIVPWPYAALIRHSAEMVLLVDADGAIRYANDAASAFFKGSDFVGLDTFFDRIHPDDLERARAIYGRRTRTRGVGERRHRFRLSHAELGWRTIEATADNLLDDPAVGGIVVNACDVTDQVRAERVLHGLGETVVDGAGVGTDSH
jgi:PAS domain S-box-containing protein